MSLLGVLKFITNHPVNRRQRARAVTRFATWQISSRLAPGAILYDWIGGARFLARTGETGLTGNIYTGLHEFSDMGFVLHVLRPCDTFVDVGANVGSYTILAGATVGARGYAFEPVPSTFQKLVANIRLNGMENRIRAFNVGLAESKGMIRFTGELDTVNHVLSAGESSGATIDVQVTSLDEATSDIQPNLIKIDVEGYETPVLHGAVETLLKTSLHSIIMELNGSGNRYGFDESKLLSLLADAGFKSFAYDPLSRELTNLHGKNHAQGNTIFIRDEAFVRQRIRSAPRFDVLGVSV